MPVYVFAPLPPSQAQRAAKRQKQQQRRRPEPWYQVRALDEIEYSPSLLPKSLDDQDADCRVWVLADEDMHGL